MGSEHWNKLSFISGSQMRCQPQNTASCANSESQHLLSPCNKCCKDTDLNKACILKRQAYTKLMFYS